MKKSLSILFLFLLTATAAHPQSRKVQKEYNLAYQLLNQKKYGSAKDAFNRVRISGEDNKLVENAHFFYAQAALENNELDLAKRAFQAMLERYPNWIHRAEIYYAMADIHFQTEEYELALSYLAQIKIPEFVKDVIQIKGFYLTKTPLLRLRILHQTFPQDTLIAQLLVDKIAATSDKVEDYDLLESLVAQYQLQRPEKSKLQKIVYRRQPYKIGVMLPFDFARLKNRDTTALAEVAINMYQGMRLAQQELDSLTKVRVRLYAYDVNRNALPEVNQWALSGEFNDMDLVVGPLFADSYEKMTNIAQLKSFNLVQPLNITSAEIPSPFTYTLLPAIQEQTEDLCGYISDNIRNKTVLILYDRLNKAFAFAFQQKAQSLGIKVLAIEEIKTVELNQIRNILGQFRPVEIGAMLVSSTSQLLAQEVLKYSEALGINAPSFVPNAWLRFQDIDYETFEQRQIFFLSPDYINFDTPAAVKFKSAYQKSLKGLEPSQHAYIGYELMHLFGQMLHQYGTQNDFRRVFARQGHIKGKIIEGFDFSKGSINSYMPILRIKEGEPELVNPVR